MLIGVDSLSCVCVVWRGSKIAKEEVRKVSFIVIFIIIAFSRNSINFLCSATDASDVYNIPNTRKFLKKSSHSCPYYCRCYCESSFFVWREFLPSFALFITLVCAIKTSSSFSSCLAWFHWETKVDGFKYFIIIAFFSHLCYDYKISWLSQS